MNRNVHEFDDVVLFCCSMETSRKVRTLQEEFESDRLGRIERVRKQLDSVNVSP